MKSCRNGFTLVELTVIIVILGVLAVFATGRSVDNDFFEARGYHDELVAATRFAQRYAVASGCSVQIDIQPSSYALTLAGPCPTGVGNPVQSPTGDNFAGNAPAGVTTSGAIGAYVFDAWGDIGITAESTITVSGGSNSLSFVIHGNSGFVDLP